MRWDKGWPPGAECHSGLGLQRLQAQKQHQKQHSGIDARHS